MRLVGLTGGIASGKSTISNLFKSTGIPVVDADIVARDVVQKGTGCWKKIGCKVIILDIPLLFETKMDQWTNPVIVVWVDPETQIERLMSRDGSSEEQARNRINAQLALDWKKSEADIVINNSGSLDDTKEQFQKCLSP